MSRPGATGRYVGNGLYWRARLRFLKAGRQFIHLGAPSRRAQQARAADGRRAADGGSIIPGCDCASCREGARLLAAYDERARAADRP